MTKEEIIEEIERIKRSRLTNKDELIRELELKLANLSNNNEQQNIQLLLAKAIIGTIDNRPRDHAIGKGLALALVNLNRDHLSNEKLAEFLCTYFSVKSKRFNVILREEVLNYYQENPDANILIDILSLLEKYTDEKDKLKKTQDLVHAIIKNNNADRSESVPYLIDVHAFCVQNNINYRYYGYVLSQFKDRIDMQKLFQDAQREEDDIEIEEITNTGKGLLFNSDGFVLRDSFSGTLLGGNIDVVSDRGYINSPNTPQQDAVGSLVIDENHYINIVADGVGSDENGQIASLEFVKEMLNWYRLLPYEIIDDIDKISFILNNRIKAASRKIREKYGENTRTTYVIALTVGDKTIISNVGDSTAYAYDEETDELIELTTKDSYSYGLSYDEARNNPSNNVVTSVIGGSNEVQPHTNIIDNNGQTIILSSDGITDLASEETFKNYFRYDTSAKEMVRSAVYIPDQNPHKTEDNVSAIKIKLPNGNVKRRGL